VTEREYTQFVDDLVADFGIPDRKALEMMLLFAEEAQRIETWFGPGGAEGVREADALDELGPALWKTVDVMDELEWTLAMALVGVKPEEMTIHRDSEVSKMQRELRELRDRLVLVGRAAAKVPRLRRGTGQHHGEHNMVRRLVDVVVGYWKHDLGRKFKQDHTSWAEDRDGRLMPTKGEGLRFVFQVVEHVAPGSGATLKTIAREFTGK
jgi:hypothetical protein